MGNFINSLKQTPLWVRVLHAIVAVQLLAMSKPILVDGGSQNRLYLLKQTDLKQVEDVEAAESLDAIIDGTASQADYDQLNKIDSEPSQDRQALITKIDLTVGYFFILVAIFTLLWRRKSWVLAVILSLISIWCVLDSYSAVLNGGKAFSAMTPYSLAARSVCPLLLALLFIRKPIRKDDSSDLSSTSINLIDFTARIAIASTFFAHGYKAVTGYFHFQDLIILSARKIGWDIPAETAQTMLKIIGYQDIVLAVVVLLIRSKAVLYWIAAWGIITAFSRVSALGLEAYDQVLVRAANGGLALMLIALYCWYYRASSGNYLRRRHFYGIRTLTRNQSS